MKELIDPRAVEKGLLFLAVAGPLVGVIFGAIVAAHEQRSWPRIVMGLLIGALGSVVYGLWHVYGAITGVFGLDSVANLGLQLLLFAILGGVLGVAIFRISAVLRRPSVGR